MTDQNPENRPKAAELLASSFIQSRMNSRQLDVYYRYELCSNYSNLKENNTAVTVTVEDNTTTA